jgi:uncharacterized membrane protein
MMTKDIVMDKQRFRKIALGFIAGVVVISIISIIIVTTAKSTDNKNLDNLRNITGMFELYLSVLLIIILIFVLVFIFKLGIILNYQCHKMHDKVIMQTKHFNDVLSV